MNENLEDEDNHPPSGLISKFKNFLGIPFYKNAVSFRGHGLSKRCG